MFFLWFCEAMFFLLDVVLRSTEGSDNLLVLEVVCNAAEP